MVERAGTGVTKVTLPAITGSAGKLSTSTCVTPGWIERLLPRFHVAIQSGSLALQNLHYRRFENGLRVVGKGAAACCVGTCLLAASQLSVRTEDSGVSCS
jgi:hypothetical protein